MTLGADAGDGPGRRHLVGRRRARPDHRRPRLLLRRRHRHPGRRRRHRPHRARLPARARAVRRHGHDQAARRVAERLPPARPERLRRALDLRAALVRRLARRQTATFRLPPGTYATGAISFGLAADGAKEGIVTLRAVVHRLEEHRDRARRERDRPLRLPVDRPVVDDGAILDVAWNGDAGYTGFTFFGSVDRLYARPSAGLSGGIRRRSPRTGCSASRRASSPPREGKPVALRPLTAAGGSLDRDAGPAGSTAASGSSTPAAQRRLRTTSVKGAVAVVSGTCDDLTATAAALKKAGAAAMVAYAGPGADVRRDGRRASRACRRCRLGRYDAAAPAGRRPATAPAGHPREPGLHVRPGAALGRRRPRRWHRRRHRARPSRPWSSTTGHGQHQRRRRRGRRGADRLGAQPRRRRQHRPGPPVPFPTTVTHYVSTGRGVGADRGRAGRRVRRRVRPALGTSPDLRRWQHARTTPGSAGRSARGSHRCSRWTTALRRRRREDDEMFLSHGRIHRCGRAHGELRHLQQRVQRQDLRRRRADPRHVRVGVHEHDRARRASTATAWSPTPSARTCSGSGRPGSRPSGASTRTRRSDFRSILPMLGIDYRMALSSTNTRPPRPLRLRRGASRCPNGVKTLPVVSAASRSPGTAGRPGSRPT